MLVSIYISHRCTLFDPPLRLVTKTGDFLEGHVCMAFYCFQDERNIRPEDSLTRTIYQGIKESKKIINLCSIIYAHFLDRLGGKLLLTQCMSVSVHKVLKCNSVQ